jgi:dissimilatory sulfite reductase (desulfoviridin) alpha/beta subunit
MEFRKRAKAINYFFRQMEKGLIEDDEQQENYEIAIKSLSLKNIELKDIKTLKEVSEEYKIGVTTLAQRMKLLIERKEFIDGKHYKKLGKGQGTLLSPEGVEEIVHYKYLYRKGGELK